MNPVLTQVIDNLTSTRRFTLAMLSDVPAEQLAAQLPGAPNHFIFTLGHLACATNFFVTCIGGTALAMPPGFDKAFGHGVKPTANLADYPPIEDVKAFAEATIAAFAAQARTLSDQDLAAPCPNGGGGFLPNQLQAILSHIWHEGWHAGQLSSLRRHLGLKSLMG